MAKYHENVTKPKVVTPEVPEHPKTVTVKLEAMYNLDQMSYGELFSHVDELIEKAREMGCLISCKLYGIDDGMEMV